MGNRGERSSGPTGSFVPGWSGGCKGSDSLGKALNHAVGMSSVDKSNRTLFIGLPPHPLFNSGEKRAL
jgi:hypothetical protein